MTGIRDRNTDMENEESIKNALKIAKRVALTTIGVNIFLSVFKLISGIVGNSGAMVSDAVHSASDVFSTLVVIAGIKLSMKEADEQHPYGHERLECVAALILSFVLFMTGLGIGVRAFREIFMEDPAELKIPGAIAMAGALISILLKEAMFHYTVHYARKIDSDALMADAWHHRSDALSSVGALVGVAGAMMGFPLMDPLACIVIFGFIAKASVEIFTDAVNRIVDHSCDEKTEDQIRKCVMNNKRVLAIDELRTRMFGNRIYVDLEISADAMITLLEAHGIAQEVHDEIERRFPRVKHIMVHVNPFEPEDGQQ